jgi:RNA polymerase sigma-70 factor (ECF subfamily)
MHEITTEILSKAAQGDIKSFEAIYKATSGFVYNVAYRVVHNSQDAEEITQEVFLNVHRKLKYFRGQSSFKTWVYRIAANCAINHSKKTARERVRRDEYCKYLNPWDASKKPDGSGCREVIDLFLKVLNPDQRLCVTLRNIEGLNYQQIAHTLNISINTVRSRLSRAREKLLAMRKEVIKDEL